MAELCVEDIFHEYKDEIEVEFIKIKEVSGGLSWVESQFFVGMISRMARKIYMRYGQRIVSYENSSCAEQILYNQLLFCTRELQKKYLGYSI